MNAAERDAVTKPIEKRPRRYACARAEGVSTTNLIHSNSECSVSHAELVQGFCTYVNRYPASKDRQTLCRIPAMAIITNREHMKQVAQNIERVMEALNLTRTDVAKSMDISLQKLGNWLRPDNYPDPYLITLFCAQYGVTMDFLYRGTIYGLQGDVVDGLAKERKASAVEKMAPKRRVREKTV